MAALLLVVASLNVANMQLARGTNRRKEIATRLALGAGRGRVVCQLLVEGLLLSVVGGAAWACSSASWTLKLVAISFAPVVDEVLAVPAVPDIRLVFATGVFCLLSAGIFAVGPAFTLSRVNILGDLKGRGDTAAQKVPHAGPRHLVVAWQVALSLALLATAGLFVRAAIAAGQADPGYPLVRQVLLRVEAPGTPPQQGRQAFNHLLEGIRTTPGVESAAPATLVAFGSSHSSRRVAPSGAAANASGPVVAQDYAAGADYFRTLGLAVWRGREFTPAEESGPARSPVVIIDEPLAQVLFPGKDPVGQYVEFPTSHPGGGVQTFQVVGLVAGQRERLTDKGPVPHVYQPTGSHYEPRLTVHVRVASDMWAGRSAVIARLRDTVRDTDPRLALLGAATLEDARDQVPLNWLIRMAGIAFGWLGGVGLAMAVIGLYGVKAYLVARRTREIGIRMTLGATPQGIVALVVGDGTTLIVAGIAFGLLLALGAGYLVSSLVVGVHPLDPLVFSTATLVLVTAVAAASYLPARRATRVDPSVAFRSE